MAAVETFRFLGSSISQDLKWEANIDTIRKKAQQRMYFLCQLRKSNLPQELLIQFYTNIIQSFLCYSITLRFWSVTKQDRTGLQRTVNTTKRIIGTSMPSFQDCYESGNGPEESLQIHHSLVTTCSNSSPLVGATEHCTPKQAIQEQFLLSGKKLSGKITVVLLPFVYAVI